MGVAHIFPNARLSGYDGFPLRLFSLQSLKLPLPADLDLPALLPHGTGALLARPDGGCRPLTASAAANLLARERLFVCHRLFVERRLGIKPGSDRLAANMHLFDLMELFAFVCPARPCIPNSAGLARALGMPPFPPGPPAAHFLRQAAEKLFSMLQAPDYPRRAAAGRRAEKMAALGWNWGAAAAAAAGGAGHALAGESGADSYALLTPWHEAPPPKSTNSAPLSEAVSEAALGALLARRGLAPREGQKFYARAAVHAFGAHGENGGEGEEEKQGEVVLIQAGTGTGKTMAYAAPALLAAARDGPPVWIATYTRNLQSQIAQELQAVLGREAMKPGVRPPAPGLIRAVKPVIRKGRENYLCLLNFDARLQNPADKSEALLAAFIARWIPETADGDLRSGDFPAWLASLVGGAPGAFTDRRGECIHTACPHYRICFVEKARARAAAARLVIANHALVLTHAGLRRRGGVEEAAARARASPYYIFDEAHHLFDSADAAFSTRMTGAGMAEFHLWLFGRPRGSSAALRGLARRLAGLLDDADESLLAEMLAAADFLPRPGWLDRLKQSRPSGAAEKFLHLLADLVETAGSGYDPSYDSSLLYHRPAACDKAQAALGAALVAFLAPARRLLAALAAESETASRSAREAAMRVLAQRVEEATQWQAILDPADAALPGAQAAPAEEQIVIARAERAGGKLHNIGLHLHYLDPTGIFARSLLQSAPGALLTSASLQEQAGAEAHENWQNAEWRTGGHHLTPPPRRVQIPSPFDYANASLVLAVKTIPLADEAARHEALRDLFLAARGGALGLFTSIRRLRAAAKKLQPQLAREGLLLLAQHEDPLAPAGLVEFFRAEPKACLLGTDALRDGVDVPGEGLKLLVFDRLPYPRPDALHAARRNYFGGYAYDARITRLRLHQAFGRLIRREGDKGIFVLLDPRFNRRFAGAFPPETPIKEVDLQSACRAVRAFFSA